MNITFIKKNYLWIAIILFVIGVLIDLNFRDAIPIVTKQKHFNADGQIQYIDILTYSYKNEIAQIFSSILYSLAVSLIILLAIQVKYDEAVRGFEKTNYENDKKNYEEKINNLHDEINKNIFEGVLKKVIPPEIFDLIKKEFISKSIIARNTLWIYDIKNNLSNSFDLKMTLSWELHNISKTTITDCIEITIDSSTKSAFDYFKLEKNNQAIVEKNSSNIFELVSKYDNIERLFFEFELHSGEYIKVISTLVHCYDVDVIYDHHWFRKSNIDFTLEVNKPDNCEFIMIPTFSEKLHTQIHTETKILFKKVSCILQGQGYSYIIKAAANKSISASRADTAQHQQQ